MENKPYPYYYVENIKTLKDLLELCRKKYSLNKAFWFADKKGKITEIAYSEFVKDVDRFVTFLLQSGLNNENIAIYGENSYEWILTYFAVTCSGNVIVPIDKNLTYSQANKLIERSDCKAVFYTPEYSDEVNSMDLESIDIFCTSDIRQFINNVDMTGIFYRQYKNSYINSEKIAGIFFTSGTTGLSKGVILTHGNLASDAVNSSRNLFVPRGTVLLLPLHHAFGMMAGVICQLLMGYSIFINSSLRFLQRDIQLAKPGHLSVVPLIMDALLKSIWENAEKQGKSKALKYMVLVSNSLLNVGIDLRKILFKSVIAGLGGNLSMLISGGSAISQKTIDGLSAFGIKMINGYGITECSAIVATTRNKHDNFPSVGSVIPECSVRILNPDSDGNGEILVKGPTVFKGYYNDEKSTTDAFDSEWFKTGDIGRLDDNGFLYITGRIKNLIILSNGENVSPEELESILYEIKEIKEVIVYSFNEILKAEIYPNYEIEEVENIIKIKISEMNKNLPAYKKISALSFRDTEFNKTTTKKIIR